MTVEQTFNRIFLIFFKCFKNNTSLHIVTELDQGYAKTPSSLHFDCFLVQLGCSWTLQPVD